MKTLTNHISEKLIINKDCENVISKYQSLIDMIINYDWEYESDRYHTKITLGSKSWKISDDIKKEIRRIHDTTDKLELKNADGWYDTNLDGACHELLTKRNKGKKYIWISIYSYDSSSWWTEYRSKIVIDICEENYTGRIAHQKKTSHFNIPGELIREIADAVAQKYHFEYLKR